MATKKVLDSCCGAAPSKPEEAPNHSAELNRLNRIRGQLDGVRKMIEVRKYCPDILTQTSAIKAAIASLESSILEKHLKACVRSAFKAKGAKIEETIGELLDIYKRNSK